MKSPLSLVFFGLLAMPALAQEPTPEVVMPKPVKLGQAVDASIALKDIDGVEHKLGDFRGKITVVNFWSFTCPIQKAWDPRLAEIHKTYGKKGVAFLSINANGGNGEIGDAEPADGKKPYQKIRDALKKNELPYTVLVDDDNLVADLFGAKTTPDIFVFDAEGKLVYRGLIDDDMRGSKGEKANHYLANTLDALLAGKEIEPMQNEPRGCSIKRTNTERMKKLRGKSE